MNDFKTSDIVAYALDALGYPILAADARNGDSDLLDIYVNLVKYKLSKTAELKTMFEYFI